MPRKGETRSISAENPDGSRGGGAKATPDTASPARALGRGWKVRPNISLKPGSSVSLAAIEGPGIIQHIWIGTEKENSLRTTLLKIFWDDEEKPSIEVPLGDFFVCTHSKYTKVSSLPVAVNPTGGLNCYWPMPFGGSAKIVVENLSPDNTHDLYYQITYSLTDIPKKVLYLHSQWRRSVTDRDNPEHVILDGVKGCGHYVGTVLSWTQLSDGWWGEGEVKFFIDDDNEFPTICGTGTEDYFGGAWGFMETFSSPFSGYPQWITGPEAVPKHGLYRWHIMDPIAFRKNLRVTIQALGWWPGDRFQPLSDDIASVAYWYQEEPHSLFPPTPALEELWPR